MARTAIAVQSVLPNKSAQLTYSAADSANGMNYPNTGKEELLVRNASGSSINVTITSVPCSHGRTGNIVQAVAAGAEAVLGPFDPLSWSQSDGTVWADFSASTSVTVALRQNVGF